MRRQLRVLNTSFAGFFWPYLHFFHQPAMGFHPLELVTSAKLEFNLSFVLAKLFAVQFFCWHGSVLKRFAGPLALQILTTFQNHLGTIFFCSRICLTVWLAGKILMSPKICWSHHHNLWRWLFLIIWEITDNTQKNDCPFLMMRRLSQSPQSLKPFTQEGEEFPSQFWDLLEACICWVQGSQPDSLGSQKKPGSIAF